MKASQPKEQTPCSKCNGSGVLPEAWHGLLYMVGLLKNEVPHSV